MKGAFGLQQKRFEVTVKLIGLGSSAHMYSTLNVSRFPPSLPNYHLTFEFWSGFLVDPLDENHICEDFNMF